MYKTLAVAVTLLLSAAYALAESSGEKVVGSESKGFKWDMLNTEKTMDLKLAGDVKAGQQLIAYGKALDDRDCVQYHQANGYGIKEKAYPVIAGQHYNYLLRQMIEIRDGKRRNSHPEMVSVIAKYDNAQLVAIAAYQAMLTTRMQKFTSSRASASQHEHHARGAASLTSGFEA